MNKLILCTIILLGSLTAISQTFTQANEPVIGDMKTMFLCDSFVTAYPTTIGNGVTWDYSSLPSYVGETKTIEVLASTATPFSSDFPSATKSILIEDFSYTYYSSTISNRISHGYVLEGTDMGDIKAVFSSDDQILMNYPMTMNAYVNDSFAGNLNFVYGTIPQNPSMMGNSRSVYQGIGTLLLPDGSTLSNVSRFLVQDTAVVLVPILGTTKLIRSQYEYYDVNGTDFLPVFLHLSAKVVSGFPDPLLDQTIVLSSVSGSPVASVKKKDIANFIVYPNPAKDLINIKNLTINTDVNLIDVTGRKIQLQMISNSQFNIAGINSGMYMLQFVTESGTQSQSLIIE